MMIVWLYTEQGATAAVIAPSGLELSQFSPADLAEST